MSVAIVTGSLGLIGSEAVTFLADKGLDVAGIDNDMRGRFFGSEASTRWMEKRLKALVPAYAHHDIDIRDTDAVNTLFAHHGKRIRLVVHCAGQPSHDWAASDPTTDFAVNANGTLVMLEATRKHAPDAVFVFVSTNKVYGDTPNRLPLVELETRWEVAPDHRFNAHGIDESMSVDNTTHSLFGVSKTAADLMVQEYGRYFGMRSVCFRGSCLTGPAHSGTRLHGFLSYLMRCATTSVPYTIYGYKGKQVRDNIHSHDFIDAIWRFFENPRSGAVYNMGGGRGTDCSVIEAILLAEKITGRPMSRKLDETNRVGDHIWFVSDTRRFERDFPTWGRRYDLKAILTEIYEAFRDRLAAT